MNPKSAIKASDFSEPGQRDCPRLVPLASFVPVGGPNELQGSRRHPSQVPWRATRAGFSPHRRNARGSEQCDIPGDDELAPQESGTRWHPDEHDPSSGSSERHGFSPEVSSLCLQCIASACLWRELAVTHQKKTTSASRGWTSSQSAASCSSAPEAWA
jgi:hypothetical protein